MDTSSVSQGDYHFTRDMPRQFCSSSTDVLILPTISILLINLPTISNQTTNTVLFFFTVQQF